MIEIKNIKHTYVPKRGRKVEALVDVDFTFPDKGMYFLTGKSGSGKSTLLNLLSGIEGIQSGEILINNQPMSKFSAKDYDNYRNNYAGIIFQEFNLIESMTVFENIDLPLKLQGKTNNNELIAECLKKVKLEGYENRFPYELSGGERQRITIARQLAKGSKLILADEPSGSLDSENGENVFELLKDLSKDILIVVASHDFEFAKKYGDVIITLIDGKIKNVETINEPNTSKTVNEIEYKKSRFPLSYTSKMARKDILNTKWRFIVATFLCFISFALFGLFLTFVDYNSERAIARTLVNRRENVISIGVADYNEKGITNTELGFSKKFNQAQIDYIEKNCGKSMKTVDVSNSSMFYRFINTRSSGISSRMYTDINNLCVIDNVEDLEGFGYNVASGYLPLSNDSVYITDYFAYVIIHSGLSYYEDGDYVPIDKNASIYSLVGKTVSNYVNDGARFNNDVKTLKIAGIINTDYTRFMDKLDRYDEKDNEYAEYNYLCSTIYMTLFCNADYLNSTRGGIELKINRDRFYNVQLNDKEIEVFTIYNNFPSLGYYRDHVVLYKDSYTTQFEDIKLSKNQIIVTLDVYNKVFGESKPTNYYCSKENTDENIKIKAYPSHLGEKVKLDLFEVSTDTKVESFEEIEIVGVILNSMYYMISSEEVSGSDYTVSFSDYRTGIIYAGDENYKTLLSDTIQYSKINIQVKNNKNDMTELLQGLRDNHILANNYFTESIYKFDYAYSYFDMLFLIFGIIMLIFSMILFANFTTITIINRKKDIGIIRAVGGSKKDIFRIFLTEGLISVITVITLSLVVSLIMTHIMEGIFVKTMIEGCELLVFNRFNFLIIPMASIIVMLITTYLPVRKFNKKSPVEIIRNN